VISPLEVLETRDAVSPLLPQLVELADRHKESLGFLSATAFGEACVKERILVAVAVSGGAQQVVGYVLFGGVFPQARIYQTAVHEDWRRNGLASRLIRTLIGRLEQQGFLSLSAKVASDLSAALSFYKQNGFQQVRRIPGGASRSREIVVVARPLNSTDLFSSEKQRTATENLISLAFRSSKAGDAPFYVMDLNVLFDLLRTRSRTASARKLFGAALAHKIRLVISPEFLVELRRTSFDSVDDAVLQMALQLPQLVTPTDANELRTMAAKIHRIVFEDTMSRQAGTEQSISDARHVAHAAIARASAYITSDRAILSEAVRLRKEIGVDVASLDELVELLSDELNAPSHIHSRGEGFEFSRLQPKEVREYFSASPELATCLPMLNEQAPTTYPLVTAARQAGNIVAVCAVIPAVSIQGRTRIILHPNPRWLDGDYFLDALFDRAISDLASGPIALELLPIADQSLGLVTSFAISRGFLRTPGANTFLKVAIAQPVTPKSWPTIAAAVRHRTGLLLGRIEDAAGIEVEVSPQAKVTLPFAELEELLSPAIIAWPGRVAVIQPIGRPYADDLLGTSQQHSLLDSRRASFLSRRSYVSSPRAARLMVPGSIMFFYESQRTGGRGAITAVARIVDALSVPKHSISTSQLEHVVVDDVSKFSRADDVLLTSFDNLLIFPRPCVLANLRELGAVGSQNLQSTTPISYEAAVAVLESGWELK